MSLGDRCLRKDYDRMMKLNETLLEALKNKTDK
jgi:hypothetical protein